MADNVARIRFGVEGGASIDTGSGADIYQDLLQIAKNISGEANRPKIKFGLDDASLQSSKAFNELVNTLKSINTLVDTISQKKFSVNQFVSGTNVAELTKQKNTLRSYANTLRDATLQLTDYSTAAKKFGRDSSDSAERFRQDLSNTMRMLMQVSANYDSFTHRISQAKTVAGLSAILDEMEQQANLVRAVQNSGSQYMPNGYQAVELIPPDLLKNEATAVQQNNKALNDHTAQVRDASTAESEKATNAQNLVLKLGDELKALLGTGEAAEESAESMKALSQFTDEVGAGFKSNSVVLGDLRKSLKALGLQDETIDKISSSFNNLSGSITAVDLQYHKNEKGKLDSIRVITHAVDENNNAFQRQSDFIRKTTKEAEKWVETTKAAAKIKFTTYQPRSTRSIKLSRQTSPLMDLTQQLTNIEDISAQKSAITSALAAAKKYGITNADVSALSTYSDSLAFLNQQVKAGKVSQEEFANTFAKIRDGAQQSVDAINKTVEAEQARIEAQREVERQSQLMYEQHRNDVKDAEKVDSDYNKAIAESAAEQKRAAQQELATYDQLIAKREKGQAAHNASVIANTMSYEQQQQHLLDLENVAKKVQSTLHNVSKTSLITDESKSAYDNLKRLGDGIFQMQQHVKNGLITNDRYRVLWSRLNSEVKLYTQTLQGARQANSKNETGVLSQQKMINKLTTYYHQFEKQIKLHPQLMAQYNTALESLKTDKFNQNTKQAAIEVQKFMVACEEAGINGIHPLQNILGGFWNKLKFGSFAALAGSVRRLARQVYTNVVEIDDAMTQLRIVTGATGSEMNQFFVKSTDLASKLGKSVKDVLGSIETFSRLGYTLEESSTLAEYANILSNVANVDASAATTGLTSIIKGYNLEVSDSEHIADVLINVGQKYAISASELMDAFERGGAALYASGTEFEKSAALFAASNSAIQNADKVGTAFQTVSARIRKSESELEELGADYEDIANGMSKYRDELKALTNVNGTGGFDIMMDADHYKDIYDIFVGIAEVWDKMTDPQRARTAEILGGTRQLSIISSTIAAISDAEKALGDAMNSAGVATEAQDIYMQSITGHIQQLSADFQKLSYDLLNSDIVKFFVDAGDAVVKFVDKIAETKTVIPIIAALGAGINVVTKRLRVVGYTKYIDVLTASLDKLSGESLAATKSMIGVAEANKTVAAASFKTAAGIGIVITAISAVIAIYQSYKSAQRNAWRESMDSAKAASEEATELYDLYTQYTKLSKEVKDNADVRDDLIEVEDKLFDKFGDEREQIQGLAGDYDAAAESIKNYTIAKLREKAQETSEGVTAAEKNFIDSTRWLGNDLNSVQVNFSRRNLQADLEAANILANAGYISRNTFATGGMSTDSFGGLQNLNTIEGAIEAYQKIDDALKLLFDQTGDTDNDVYQALLELRNHSKDAYQQYTDSVEANRQVLSEISKLTGSGDASTGSIVHRLIESLDFKNNTKDVYDSRAALEEWLSTYKQYKDLDPDSLGGSSRTQFGNIDLMNRGVLEWTKDNIDEYRDALQSLGYAEEELLGSISTVMGSAGTYDGIDIAFSPILQTEDGPKLLSSDVVDQYIFGLLDQMPEGWTDEDLFAVDVTGLDIAGEHIHGLIAGIGEDAIRISEIMHFLGKDGALSQAVLNLSSASTVPLVDQVSGFVDALSVEQLEALEDFLSDGHIYKDINELAEAFATYYKTLSNFWNGAGKDVFNFTSLDKFKDAISSLNDAFDDLSADDSIGITYSHLKKIKEEFADIDGVDEYIERLSAAGTNAEEVNKILNELAKAKLSDKTVSLAAADANESVVRALLEEAGVANAAETAMDTLAVAHGVAALNAASSEDDINTFINSLWDEAQYSNAARDELILLAGQMIITGQTKLDLSGQYNQLKNLAIMAGVTSEAIANAGSGKQTSLQDLWDDIQEKVESGIQYDFTTRPKTSGGGSSKSKNLTRIEEIVKEYESATTDIQYQLNLLERQYEQLEANGDLEGMNANLAKQAELHQQLKDAAHNTADTLRAFGDSTALSAEEAAELAKQLDALSGAWFDNHGDQGESNKQRFDNDLEDIKKRIEENGDAVNGWRQALELLDDYFNRGLISYKDYVDTRKELGQEWVDAEIEAVDDYIAATDDAVTGWKSALSSLEQAYANELISFKTYSEKHKEIGENLYNAEIDAIDEYIDRCNALNDWGTDNEVNARRKQLAVTEDYYRQGLISYEKYKDSYNSYTQELYNAEMDALEERAQRQKKRIEEQIKALEKRKEAVEKSMSGYDATVNALTDFIDKAIDALDEENSELEKQKELQEKLMEIERLKHQQTLRIYREGVGFVYEQDTEAIKEAQDAYDSLVEEMDKDRAKEKLEDLKEAIQSITSQYTDEKNAALAAAILGEGWEDTWTEYVDRMVAGGDAGDSAMATLMRQIRGYAGQYSNLSRQVDEDVKGSITSQINSLNDASDKWDEWLENVREANYLYVDELYNVTDIEAEQYDMRLDNLSDYVESSVLEYQKLASAAANAAAAQTAAQAASQQTANSGSGSKKNSQPERNELTGNGLKWARDSELYDRVERDILTNGSGYYQVLNNQIYTAKTEAELEAKYKDTLSKGEYNMLLNSFKHAGHSGYTDAPAALDIYNRYEGGRTIRSARMNDGTFVELGYNDENGNFVATYEGLSEDLKKFFDNPYTANWGTYAEGGVVDYDGPALVHGKQSREIVFNGKDANKLYNYIHTTPDLIASMLNSLGTPSIGSSFFGRIRSVMPKPSAELTGGNNASVTIGTINLHEVQNVDGLAKAIENELPGRITQMFYKR